MIRNSIAWPEKAAFAANWKETLKFANLKYYLIVGEASGDLHASHLMRSLRERDSQAEFRFFGGGMMSQVGGVRVRHYRELAYMGFVPVLLHLRTILAARRQCKEDILQWHPDAVVFVDYPGFNLGVAKYLNKVRWDKGSASPRLFYYISPKIWAWKEYRIKDIKRDIDRLFSILPFEVSFFEEKHHYPISYVGNPTANEVAEFKDRYTEDTLQFLSRTGLLADTSTADARRPVVALLAGSRKQEIHDNLPMMIRATRHLAQSHRLVVAGAPSIDDALYDQYLAGTDVQIVRGETYPLLSHSVAALVTSGTATLETACFGVPQVVLYKTPLPRIARFVWDHFFKVKYISLVNLIADREIVPEMMAEKFTCEAIRGELDKILFDDIHRQQMLEGYSDMASRLGENIAPDTAARLIINELQG